MAEQDLAVQLLNQALNGIGRNLFFHQDLRE